MAPRKTGKTEKSVKEELTKEAARDLSLEEMLEELEKCVRELQKENVPLETSFQLYARGMELAGKCSSSIDRVEKAVLKLQQDGSTVPFEEE